MGPAAEVNDDQKGGKSPDAVGFVGIGGAFDESDDDDEVDAVAWDDESDEIDGAEDADGDTSDVDLSLFDDGDEFCDCEDGLVWKMVLTGDGDDDGLVGGIHGESLAKHLHVPRIGLPEQSGLRHAEDAVQELDLLEVVGPTSQPSSEFDFEGSGHAPLVLIQGPGRA